MPSISTYRSLVPSLDKDIVYLNASFQPPMNSIVSDAFSFYLSEALHNVNPKAQWTAECQSIKHKLGKLINCQPEDIIYTRDTTESSHIFQRSIPFNTGDNVILLREEFPSHVAGWMCLIPEGLEIRFAKVKSDTTHNADTFRDYVDEHTVAIGISSIMFNSGLKNDIESICNAYRPLGIHILVDAMQEVGFGCVDVQKWGASAVAFGTNKALACPTGLGCLYIDPKTLPLLKETPPNMTEASFSNPRTDHLAPYPYECHKSTRKYEHTNMALIQCLALGKYLDFMDDVGMENIQRHIEDISRYLREQLVSIGVSIVGRKPCQRSPHCTVVKLTSPEWSQLFKENNIVVSPNSYGIRVSFGLYSNRTDVDRFTEVLLHGLNSGYPLS